jgi:hypothetical protein
MATAGIPRHVRYRPEANLQSAALFIIFGYRHQQRREIADGYK